MDRCRRSHDFCNVCRSCNCHLASKKSLVWSRFGFLVLHFFSHVKSVKALLAISQRIALDTFPKPSLAVEGACSSFWVQVRRPPQEGPSQMFSSHARRGPQGPGQLLAPQRFLLRLTTSAWTSLPFNASLPLEFTDAKPSERSRQLAPRPGCLRRSSLAHLHRIREVFVGPWRRTKVSSCASSTAH